MACSTFRDSTGLQRQNLEKDQAVIYALDRYLRIVYCNEAWDRFAAENGGLGLDRERQIGRSVMDAVPMPLKPFFAKGYQRVLFTNKNWEHNYECSSPNLYRSFQMVTYPDPEQDGLIVVNSLRVEKPHDASERPTAISDESSYMDDYGITTMCSHCRRTCRHGNTPAWDWVPRYVEKPPAQTSHGICTVCMNLFYSKSTED